MAQSLGEELRHPPDPAKLANLVAEDSFDDRSQPGTDLQHSAVRGQRRRSGNGSGGGATDRAQQPSGADIRLHTQRLGEGRCVGFDEAPPYLRREFILTGYYVGGTHWASVKRTLFGWNNETLNAWTMMGGVVLTLIGLALARQWYPTHPAPFWLMALSALPHAPFSVALHLMIGVSQRTRDTLRTLDVFFILSCGVPRGLALAWFVFTGRAAFWTYAALIAGDWAWSVCSTCVLRSIKDIPKPQLARDVTSIVLFYLTPLLCGAAQDAWRQGMLGSQAACGAAVLVLLYLASWFYSRHLPERWRPGKYDIVGNSHQIMHALVVLEYGLEWVFLLLRAASLLSPN